MIQPMIGLAAAQSAMLASFGGGSSDGGGTTVNNVTVAPSTSNTVSSVQKSQNTYGTVDPYTSAAGSLWLMIGFQSFVKEGVFDPGIFKAIFLAGGPGSGKSYVAGKTTGGFGLKLVNSDDTLEKLLKKHNVPLDFTTLSPDQTAKKDMLRTRAKEITFGQLKVKSYKGRGALRLYILQGV